LRAFFAPALIATIAATLLGACGDGGGEGGDGEGMVEVPGTEGRLKSAAAVRAQRRLYDGAPPVIPHGRFSNACTACHDVDGVALPDVGFAPPMPHERTPGMSATSRCTQCHVFQPGQGVFRESEFEGLRQDLRRGERRAAGDPASRPDARELPRVPHRPGRPRADPLLAPRARPLRPVPRGAEGGRRAVRALKGDNVETRRRSAPPTRLRTAIPTACSLQPAASPR